MNKIDEEEFKKAIEAYCEAMESISGYRSIESIEEENKILMEKHNIK